MRLLWQQVINILQRFRHRNRVPSKCLKGLIQQLEICRVQITDEVNRKEIDKVLEKMRYSDPVSSPAVATENETIRQLILQLSSTTDEAALRKSAEQS